MRYTSKTDDPAYHDTDISWHGAGSAGFKRCRECGHIIHPCDKLCDPCQEEFSTLVDLEEEMDEDMMEEYLAWIERRRALRSPPYISERAEFMEKLIGGAK
jgi:hypothetical protein